MKYTLILGSALLLSACSLSTPSSNFYEDVYKPRYKRIALEEPAKEEPAKEEVEQKAPAVEPKVEVIRVSVRNPIYQGIEFLDYTEKDDRSELKELTGVDPVRIEWCAAFANAILEKSGIPSNKDHKYPLTARAFLDWGEAVEEPKMGDIVVFPRGNQGWQGHVGFYVKEQTIDGVLYYYILGGNQKNSVRVDLYRADRAIGIRRSSLID